MRGARRIAGYVLIGLAVAGALMVHRRFPWIPLVYLGALIVLPVAAWRLARWRIAPPALRWSGACLAALSIVALCPVPWMRAELANPPGSAWQLDGRLVINGTSVDPPGTWYWLTVGRPPIVAEVVLSWLTDDIETPTSLRGGRQAQRPAVTEPAAAAVGLRRAGWSIELGVVVEVSDPIADNLPARAVVSMVNGLQLTTRETWEKAVRGLHAVNTFTTLGGDSFEFQGSAMPFRRVDVIDAPADGFNAAVGGRWARTLPGAWYRHLSLGSSHGLVVALASYVYGSGVDLADGRAIAATGTIRGDGSVGTIGGLWAKATAAREIGADVLLFPDGQAKQLDGFNPGSMRLLPVASLDEAIEALTRGE